jgi:DNA-binding transcriptional ArsR family regulator
MAVQETRTVGADARYGDVDIAKVAALFADPARARILEALGDGRALAASVLAGEAGVSAPATSAHLNKLREAGLVDVERSGRHRFYRMAGPEVSSVLEALATIAEPTPVRSLRESTKAKALRSARSCYDHLAGRLGVAVTEALLRRGALVRTDGGHDTRRRPEDKLSRRMSDHPYRLGPGVYEVFDTLDVDLDALLSRPARSRPLLRFCVDWSEQRHHLAGALGAALLTAMVDNRWLVRARDHRAVRLTDEGREALHDRLGVEAPV